MLFVCRDLGEQRLFLLFNFVSEVFANLRNLSPIYANRTVMDEKCLLVQQVTELQSELQRVVVRHIIP